MKTYRLKIITANIINENDIPEIHYVSQNNPKDKNKLPNEINNDYNNNNFTKTKETTENNYTAPDEDIKLSQNPIDLQNPILNEKKEQCIKNIKENLEINKNNNYDKNNKIYKTSNNNIHQQKYTKIDIKNYPYDIKAKKNHLLKNGNKFLFKNRIKINIKSEKIITNNNQIRNKSNLRSKIRPTTDSTKKLNKTSNNLNLNNNKKCNTTIKKFIKIAKENSNKIQIIENEKKLFKLSPKTNKNFIKINNNILSKNNSNDNTRLNNTTCSKFDIFGWEIKEKFGNLNDTLNYKEKIDELLLQKSQLLSQEKQIKQHNEEKLKPLRELNEKLLEEHNEELNTIDELNGEYIVVKNQYENLLNQLNKNKTSKNNNMNNNNNQKINHEIFTKKQTEIDNDYKLLDDYLKNGDIILITKPANYEILSDIEIKNISLMIRGFLYDFHLYKYDKLIDVIWKNDKPVQTIYFLVKEFMEFFKLTRKCDRNKLINYFYTICQNFAFLTKKNFIILLENKIGKINNYNRFLYFNKLINLYKSQLIKLNEYLSSKDVFNVGFVQYNDFLLGLKKVGIEITKKTDDIYDDSEEIFEFLIFCMKRDRNILLSDKNNFDFFNNDKEEISNKDIIQIDNCEIYNLFYGNLVDFDNEYNDNSIDEYLDTIRNYMKSKNILSAKILFKPLLIKENIISLNNIDYVDTIVLNKYFRHIDILNQNEKIYFPTYEDELVDINQLICDIDNEAQHSVKQSPEIIKQKATDLINEILDLNFI